MAMDYVSDRILLQKWSMKYPLPPPWLVGGKLPMVYCQESLALCCLAARSWIWIGGLNANWKFPTKPKEEWGFACGCLRWLLPSWHQQTTEKTAVPIGPKSTEMWAKWPSCLCWRLGVGRPAAASIQFSFPPNNLHGPFNIYYEINRCRHMILYS